MENSGRPTRAEVDLDALVYNYRKIKECSGDKKILAVVKANAYGHGAVEISRELEKLGVDYLGVAILPEGIQLRNAGCSRPILLLNGIFRGEAGYVLEHNLTPVIFSIDTASEISKEAAKTGKIVPVHVKIDTGMRRLGVLPGQVEQFFGRLKELKNITVEGVLSHFSTADSKDRDFMDEQAVIFTEAVNKIRSLGFSPEYIHIANSAAIIADKLPDYLNMVRPGITLYGSYPSIWFQNRIELIPIMTLMSGIIEIKKVKRGESVSYAKKFTAERDSIIAVAPIGYADGYPRHLSSIGEVVIRGKRAKIAGLVCMDLLMMDVTDIPDVSVGDQVVLWGAGLHLDELARKAGTISYEIYCGVSGRVPRIYVQRMN